MPRFLTAVFSLWMTLFASLAFANLESSDPAQTSPCFRLATGSTLCPSIEPKMIDSFTRERTSYVEQQLNQIYSALQIDFSPDVSAIAKRQARVHLQASVTSLMQMGMILKPEFAKVLGDADALAEGIERRAPLQQVAAAKSGKDIALSIAGAAFYLWVGRSPPKALKPSLYRAPFAVEMVVE